jgi:Terminase large subunit, T4likevirus-type, N-terminal
MIRLKAPQREVFLSPHRFRVLVAGRRFGKTYLANVELLRAASGRGRTAWYLAPTYRQAKRIAWNRLKELTRPCWASKPQESDLRIELAQGGTVPSLCAEPTLMTRCAARVSISWC